MPITDELNALWEELKQRQLANKAKSILQTARENILNEHAELMALAQDAQFNTISAEIKQALLKSAKVVSDAKTAFEDTDIVELLDWKP